MLSFPSRTRMSDPDRTPPAAADLAAAIARLAGELPLTEEPPAAWPRFHGFWTSPW